MKPQKTINPDGKESWLVKTPSGGVYLHREDGPAVLYPNGSERWYIMGLPHRENGPAIFNRRDYNNDSYYAWYRYGKIHRLDGPAIHYLDGTSYYYISNQEYQYEEYNKLIKLKAFW